MHKVSFFLQLACAVLVEILYSRLCKPSFSWYHQGQDGQWGFRLLHLLRWMVSTLNSWSSRAALACVCAVTSVSTWPRLSWPVEGQGLAALSPSHTCTGEALRAGCFSINWESPHLLQLLARPPTTPPPYLHS